jgi:hypothetical protein
MMRTAVYLDFLNCFHCAEVHGDLFHIPWIGSVIKWTSTTLSLHAAKAYNVTAYDS